MVVRLLIGVGASSLYALALFSQSVATWWGDLASADHFSSGSSLARLLTWRAGLQEADVHFLMWFVAGLVVIASCATRRAALLACSGLVALGVVIEVLQPLLSSRDRQWSDAIGGTLGVLAVVAVRAVVLTVRRVHRSTAHRFVAS